MKTNKVELEELIEKCFAELNAASQEPFETDRAMKVAAMCMHAHGIMAFIIADVEKVARGSKTNIQSVEAEKTYDIRAASTSKIAEGAMEQLVAREADVKEAKRAYNEAESELTKYKYIMATLKESHVMFRGMGKKSFGD